jgi:hypothetical protein
MNDATRSARHIGPRIACAVGLVLVVIGSLLLSIVGNHPRTRIAFIAGIAITEFGAISIAAACEAFWFSAPAKVSWRDGIRAVGLAFLLLIGGGLLVQLLYAPSAGAYELLIAVAFPLLLCMMALYLGARWVILRFGS